MRRAALALCCVLGCATARPAAVPAVPDEAEGTVAQLQTDALALLPQMQTDVGRAFLGAAKALPHVAPHPVYRTPDKKRWFTPSEVAALPGAERSQLVTVTVDEPLFYETKYGSPLAYARAFDVLGLHGFVLRGGRYADFGYGGVGSLLMMHALGYQATGIDVDPMLPAIYADVREVKLLNGAFPKDVSAGSGLDLFISKNTLKKGYLHPDRPADDRFLIHLGVTDAEYLRAVHDALAPGGWFLIYNICPALTPPDKPFVPWSDGRSPFTRAQLEAAGFEVLELDRDDTDAIRALGHTLRWDVGDGAMDLKNDLSVLYTLARRR